MQQQLLEGGSPTSDFGPSPSQNPLLTKQAIIVLREELEYFSIPPKDGNEATDGRGIANDALLDLKRNCGKYLLHKRNIFTALQRNVNKENNLAEQHLIDMLCMRCVLYSIVCEHMTDPPLFSVASTGRMNGGTVLWNRRGAASLLLHWCFSRPESFIQRARRVSGK